MMYCNFVVIFEFGLVVDIDGNIFGCCIYYVGVVGFGVDVDVKEKNVGIYCVYVGLLGGDVCGLWCNNFCYFV